MGGRKELITYKKCPKIKTVVMEIIQEVGFNHIDVSRLEFLVSKNAKARAYARIYGLPRAIQVGHDLQPLYTIEFLCEKVSGLSQEEIAKVLIHELLHIPYTFKGGLRPHGRLVNNRKAKSIAKNIAPKLKKEVKNVLYDCCKSF